MLTSSLHDVSEHLGLLEELVLCVQDGAVSSRSARAVSGSPGEHRLPVGGASSRVA